MENYTKNGRKKVNLERSLNKPKVWKSSLKYISGPFTQGDNQENISRAIMVGEFYYLQGYPIHIPHLNCRWEADYPKPYDDMMHIDLQIIQRMRHTDELIALPGCSPGRDREIECAMSHMVDVKIMTVVDCEEIEEALGEDFPYLPRGQANLMS